MPYVKYLIGGVTVLILVAGAMLFYAVDFDSDPLSKRWVFTGEDGREIYVYGQAWGMGGGVIKYVISCTPLSDDQVRDKNLPNVLQFYNVSELFVSQRVPGQIRFSSRVEPIGNIDTYCGATIAIEFSQVELPESEWQALSVYAAE